MNKGASSRVFCRRGGRRAYKTRHVGSLDWKGLRRKLSHLNLISSLVYDKNQVHYDWHSVSAQPEKCSICVLFSNLF
jgi:hypothetical protein